ncbi:MAG TPA: hypothetical protein VE967_18770 [Gemmatimonadaceae bacterium]|nr:hypothetical protein [Gemmatimonadaceae bacterium]
MSGPLADIFFFVAVAAVLVAHGFILRSTIRGMRADARSRRFSEWVWAFLPALSLLALFVWTWRTMHPDSLHFILPGNRLPPGGVS